MKYVFVADASCDVPQSYKDKYDIHIIPIEVDFGDEAYPDGMSNRDFYGKLAASPVMPKTAMPNAYKFEQFYKDYANKEGVFVMTLVISFEMSPTKQQAIMAAESLGMKNVFIEECKTTTIPQGAIICELCKYLDKYPDASPEALIEHYYYLRKKVQIYAIINDLKYLKNSGRLSSTSATIGSMLNIKPIVAVIDGKVTVIHKAVGTPKAEKYLLDKLQNMDTRYMFIAGHSDNEETAKRFAEKCKPYLAEGQEQLMCEIGYVVGTHVGAKCYGVVIFEKD